jgi:hypothetical protein
MDAHSAGAFAKDDYPHPDFAKLDQIQPGITTGKQVEALLVAPPSMSQTFEGDTRECRMWFDKFESFEGLYVYVRRDGIVDEVEKYFKGNPWFPQKVSAEKVASISERRSTRKEAESILGSPWAIGRITQGTFYTYFIKVGKTNEVIYIDYDNGGTIARLIRKPLPEQK